MENKERENYGTLSTDFNSDSANFSRSNLQLNVEQINWLISIISTDDRDKLTKVARDCSSEINLTRGLPLTAAVCGSIYYARNKLPVKYHFGPKGWPMYLLLTFGTITFTNLLYAETCNKRIKPVLNDLYQKYTSNETQSSKKSYDALRMANRRYGTTTPQTLLERPQISSADRYEPSQQTFDVDNLSEETQKLKPSKFIYDTSPLISGTPYDINSNNQGSGKSKYGDEGFS